MGSPRGQAHPNNLFRGSASDTTGRKFHPLASPAEGLNGSPFETAETAEILSVMAGKTGINFERCNVASAELHNTRNKAYIAAVNSSPKKKYDIFEDESKNNVSWVNQDYQGKTLPKLLDELRALYKEKVGQAPQEKDRIRRIKDKKTGMMKEVTVAGWSPIREGVCPIKEDTRIEDFRPFIAWLEDQGVKVVRIDLHHDEGYTDLLTKERSHNHHAHVVVDWVNHETGRTAKLDNLDASEMQTQIARALGMERGEAKTITGKEHLSSDRQRAKAEAAELERVKQRNEELKAEKARLEKQVADSARTVHTTFGDLVEYGKLTVENFDKICNNDGAVLPTKQEKGRRDFLEQECNKDFSEYGTDSLNDEAGVLHVYIAQTQAAIKRIGQKLQEIANNIPTLSFLPSRKRKLLAHEAALEQKVADAQSEAEKAVESAENDQKTAIAEAQRAANAKVAAAQSEARLAKEAAAKAETKAKEREQAAKAEENKYKGFNTGFEQQIADAKAAAKQEGYDDGYAAGVKTNAEEVEKWKAKFAIESKFASFCVKTNPLLQQNFNENFHELNSHEIFKFTPDEINRLFAGEAVEKTYSEMRNWKEIKIPVNIEIAKSTQGNVKVWYNDKSWEDCLKELKAQVIEQGRRKGMSL